MIADHRSNAPLAAEARGVESQTHVLRINIEGATWTDILSVTTDCKPPLAPSLSLGRVAFLADGTWRADPSGALAVLMPVHDRYGDLVDLVAWFPDKPSAWWLRYGDECPVLGARALAVGAWHGLSVRLYSTPQSWLRAQCRGGVDGAFHGVCVLRWGLDLKPLFEGVSRVDCDSAELERRLRRSWRAWEPRTSRPEGVRHAA